MSHYDVHGIPTLEGHPTIYTDTAKTHNASRLKHIKEDAPGHLASLHVYHSDGTESHIDDVPYDPHGAPHTWRHLPEK